MNYFNYLASNFWEISFGIGSLDLSYEISRKFRGPKFLANFGDDSAIIGYIFSSKILQEFWDEKRFFPRLYATSNLKEISRKFWKQE